MNEYADVGATQRNTERWLGEQIDQLRADLAAANARAEAAEGDRNTYRAARDQWKNEAYAAVEWDEELEAALAAVPVGAIRGLFRAADWYGFRNVSVELAEGMIEIEEWLAQQPEVQP